MKARIKATGEIVEVYHYGKSYYIEYIDEKAGRIFHPKELDLLDAPDYWTRLEHQYAGMAMQAYIIASHISQFSFCESDKDMRDCKNMAHALVEKMKEERE